MGLSLWIVPNSEDSKKIEALMNVRPTAMNTVSGLAQESYPKFHPHITLASLPLSMEANLGAVGSAISKIQMPPICIFTSVDIGSEYYRSVYIAIQLTPEMDSLHQYIHTELDAKPRTPFFPHLSLSYITNVDAHTAGQREKYRQALKESGKVQTKVEDGQNQGVIIYPQVQEGEDGLDRFLPHEIWAVRCEGPVESWVVLKKFALGQA